MNKSDLISAAALQAGLSKAEAARYLDCFLTVIRNALATGATVKVTGLGTFRVRARAASRCGLPTCSDGMTTAHYLVRFHPGAQLRNLLTQQDPMGLLVQGSPADGDSAGASRT